MKLLRPLALALTVAGILAPPLSGRVISYAPVTSKLAAPALQERTNRHFVLLESDSTSWIWRGGTGATTGGGGTDPGGGGGTGGGTSGGGTGSDGGGTGGAGAPLDAMQPWYTPGRLVVHDSKGEEEPRTVLPAQGEAGFAVVAAHENAHGVLQILAVTDASVSGTPNPAGKFRLLLSTDGGRNWRPLDLPQGLSTAVSARPPWSWPEDFGGPFCRGRHPVVRIGNDDTPFVLLASSAGPAETVASLLAVSSEGKVRVLAELPEYGNGIVGASASGTSFLLAGRVREPGTKTLVNPYLGLYLVRLDSTVFGLLELTRLPSMLEGWILDERPGHDDVLLEVDWAGATPLFPLKSYRGLYRVAGGKTEEILAAPSGVRDAQTLRTALFTVPTNGGYSGAWIIQRGPGSPTVLYHYSTAAPGRLVEKWRDITAPEIEALHVGSTNNQLLIQVHRPRPQMDQRIFQDPALALWKDGQPAPRSFDELFLNEQKTKGFVHLDVDTVESGTPFVFDSGVPDNMRADAPGGGSGGSAGGGSDVSQEWGVVKASLRQKLVIPAVARAPGMNGAFWKTDVLLRNPGNEILAVTLRFVPSSGESREKRVELAASEIRRIPDVLFTLFELEAGSGALFITPEGTRSLEATSRTYTVSDKGTFGMGMGAVDLFASASARFGLTFAGAFQGPDYRTNLGAVNVSARSSEISVKASGDSGVMGRPDFTFTVPSGGFAQVNGINSELGLPQWRQGAISFTPITGEAIPFLTVIDNRTNDPTYFPPDLTSTVVRMIPALVHADGANNARFRSDLFLYNGADQIRSVLLAAKRWDSTEGERIVTLTLLPHEGKTIRDALRVVFGLTGVARLRFQSPGTPSDPGVRVTSRTYTITEDEGTFGLVVPPLNAFQTAASGESLEILGITGGTQFRTNLALVEASISSNGANVKVRVEVIDGNGKSIDSFLVNVPVAGGIQIDDLFRARGLGDGPEAALIRISPLSGLVGAYATTIDQGTNDPSYFAAGLAAQD